MYVCVCECMYVHMHVCVCVYVCVCEYVYIYMCVYAYVRVCMCIYIYIYRVSQEERSVLWEATVPVALTNKLYMYMCPIPNVFQDNHFTVQQFGFGARYCPSLPPYCATV